MTNHENEIRNLLALAEEHEEANDFTAVKESLRQAQVIFFLDFFFEDLK